MYGGYQISRSHAVMLAQASRHDAEEEQQRQAAAEAHAYLCAAAAPAYHEALDLQAAAEMMRSVKLERAEQQRREQRQVDAEELRDHLLRTGQGRWRTVAEVLADARGWVR
jgi:hypothetical protein